MPTLQSANGNAEASKYSTFSISAHLKLHTGGPHVGHFDGAAGDSLPVQQLCGVVGKYQHVTTTCGVTEAKRTWMSLTMRGFRQIHFNSNHLSPIQINKVFVITSSFYCGRLRTYPCNELVRMAMA